MTWCQASPEDQEEDASARVTIQAEAATRVRSNHIAKRRRNSIFKIYNAKRLYKLMIKLKLSSQ